MPEDRIDRRFVLMLRQIGGWRIQLILALFDHPVRPRQHVRRNREADLFRGFQIDDEFELRRLLYRKIGGLGAFQDFVDIGGGAPEQSL